MYNMMMPRRARENRGNEVGFLSDRFFDTFFNMDGWMDNRAFRVDIREKADAYTLSAELPGMKQDQIDIVAQDGVLTISANMNAQNKEEKDGFLYTERRTGTFKRSFNLEGIREEAITARYEDGILTLNLPKVKPEEMRPRLRRIAIEGAKPQQADAENA